RRVLFRSGLPVHGGFAVAVLVINLLLAVVTLLKGKIWTGLAGLFVPVLLVVGAIRLARPGSPWARWFFGPGARRPNPAKMEKAMRREIRWRRPVIRAKIAFQEFLSGRHDLPSIAGSADRRRRYRRARRPRLPARGRRFVPPRALRRRRPPRYLR